MPLLRDAALTAAFDRGAGRYDRLVALNPGYHAQLRRSARRLGLADGGAGGRVLDLGCGTGASTAALAAAFPAVEIVGVDASAGMLERARAKRWPSRVRFVHAAAEDLDLEDLDREDLDRAEVRGPFDAVFAAYLFRNVSDPDAVLRSVRRMLVPGGRLAVHEYALGGRRGNRLVWDAVCRAVILPLGTATGDRELYRHLWRSVAAFDTAPAFGARLGRAGFAGVRVLPLPGWQTGITHTFVGRRAHGEPGGTARETGSVRTGGSGTRTDGTGSGGVRTGGAGNDVAPASGTPADGAGTADARTGHAHHDAVPTRGTGAPASRTDGTANGAPRTDGAGTGDAPTTGPRHDAVRVPGTGSGGTRVRPARGGGAR